jgi:hypothetical protein
MPQETCLTCTRVRIGSFQKASIPPPQRKLEVNPPTPFGCPNTFTIIRNNFVSPSPSGQQKFPPWGECGSFLERPLTYCDSQIAMHFWRYAIPKSAKTLKNAIRNNCLSSHHFFPVYFDRNCILIPILFIFFQNRYKLVIIIYIAVFAEVNELNKAEKSCLTYYNKFRS